MSGRIFYVLNKLLGERIAKQNLLLSEYESAVFFTEDRTFVVM